MQIESLNARAANDGVLESSDAIVPLRNGAGDLPPPGMPTTVAQLCALNRNGANPLLACYGSASTCHRITLRSCAPLSSTSSTSPTFQVMTRLGTVPLLPRLAHVSAPSPTTSPPRIPVSAGISQSMSRGTGQYQYGISLSYQLG
jgi:hypothetical protein